MPIAPHLIDAILGVIGVELLVLGAVLMSRGRPELIPPLAFFLLSGAGLIGALRLSLSQSTPDAGGVQALLLAGAGLAHALALWFAWRLTRRP